MPETKSADSPPLALFPLFRRAGWLIAVCVVVGGAIAYGIAHRRSVSYTATASLLFSQNDVGQQLLGLNTSQATSNDPTQVSATDATLISLPVISEMTSTALHGSPSARAIHSGLAVSSPNSSTVFSVSLSSNTPLGASRLANDYARQFVRFSRLEQQAQLLAAQGDLSAALKDTTSQDRATSNALRGKLTDLKLLTALQVSDAQVAQLASVPESPSGPRAKRAAGIGALLGLIAGCALAVLYELLGRTIHDGAAAQRLMKLPVIAAIPKLRRLALSLPIGRSADAADALTLLAAHMGPMPPAPGESHFVVVTSPQRQDGRSTLSFHLASTLACTSPSASVLLITDAQTVIANVVDVPPDSVSVAIRLPSELERNQLSLSYISVTGLHAGFCVLHPDDEQSAKAGATGSFFDAAHSVSLQDEFDVVVVDGPPVSHAATLSILTKATSVLVAVRPRHTSRRRARSSGEIIATLAPVDVGVVIIGGTRD